MHQNTLADDAATAADAIAHMATHAADQALESSHRLADGASHLAQKGSDAATQRVDVLRARAEGWEHAARSYIEHQPVKASLIAMAAGAGLVFLASFLMRGRHTTR
jgi:ElaB/YqjD/DUF883 family membrane-anchored ribosome-binding protein